MGIVIVIFSGTHLPLSIPRIKKQTSRKIGNANTRGLSSCSLAESTKLVSRMGLSALDRCEEEATALTRHIIPLSLFMGVSSPCGGVSSGTQKDTEGH